MFSRRSCRLLSGLILVTACSSDNGAAVTDPASGSGLSPRLERIDDQGGFSQPIDGWMGAVIPETIRVRVVDSSGSPVQGARVRFSVSSDGGRLITNGIIVADTAIFALSDAGGIASASGWILPSRDTINTRHVLVASVVGGNAPNISFFARAWRDLTRFGGDAPAALDMPVDRQRLSAILPLGVLGREEALPSPDALLVPKTGQSSAIRAMADGVITEIEESSGAVTMRVRDHVLVRLGGMTLRANVWVGRVLHAGDTLGVLDATKPGAMLAVRVLDASVQRTQLVNAVRYGARQNTAFFVRYLADAGVRSAAYALVRRSAPDLDGRIDYDKNGRLVGTWFDPSSPVVASFGTQLTTMSPFSARRPSELDPSGALGPVALTFAYDAERPGQVRVAAGSGLAVRLGLRGVRAVAWEDVDPAEVGLQSGVVRYHLFTNDERVGEAEHVLLVQLVDANTLRVELVPGRGASAATFSSRATILVR